MFFQSRTGNAEPLIGQISASYSNDKQQLKIWKFLIIFCLACLGKNYFSKLNLVYFIII